MRLKRRITEEVGYELIDLVTLSRPSAYVEYEPYRFVQTPEKPRPVEKPRYSIDQFQKEFEQRQRQQEDAKRKAAMAVQSALEKAAANQYRQGYGQVKEKSFQTEEIVEDSFGVRWLQCERCSAIKQKDEFSLVGRLRHPGIGICTDCARMLS